MRSLVLDQASYITGYCAVEEHDFMQISFGVTGKMLGHGIIKAPKNLSLSDRMEVLKADLSELIRVYNPDEMVVENTLAFKQPGAKTNKAMAVVYQACLDTAKKFGLDFHSQGVTTIKHKFTGNGRATKEEMIAQAMEVWGLNRWQIKDDNHADALGAAFVWLVEGTRVRSEKKQKGKKKNG